MLNIPYLKHCASYVHRIEYMIAQASLDFQTRLEVVSFTWSSRDSKENCLLSQLTTGGIPLNWSDLWNHSNIFFNFARLVSWQMTRWDSKRCKWRLRHRCIRSWVHFMQVKTWDNNIATIGTPDTMEPPAAVRINAFYRIVLNIWRWSHGIEIGVSVCQSAATNN